MTESFFDRINKNKTLHTPDVLSCLANLSNDEVFTPPDVVNKMLDMLPQELFESPETTFLDPACKTGVFLREIAKRLLVGLEKQIPDLQERIDHIFHRQLYGIAITELTSLLSRRSVYCSKSPDGRYSVSQFNSSEGNIRFRKIKHTWVNGKCKYCGTAKEGQLGDEQRGNSLETYAYEFIHTDDLEKLFNMKFDVIIGNPPYQLNTAGDSNGAQARPIYNLFVEKAKRLNPRYLVMITPSRWMTGGWNLDSYRANMLDGHIKELHDFQDASFCFPGVEIKGGVSYFLWDKDYQGDCKFYTHERDKIASCLQRPLKLDLMDTVVRYNKAVSIVKKVFSHTNEFFSSIVSPMKPFGLPTKYVGSTSKTASEPIKVYANKNVYYCSSSAITKNNSWLTKYKIIAPKAVGSGNPKTDKLKPIVSEPMSCCTETYVVLGTYDNIEIVNNVLTYINTKFFHFMLTLHKDTQDCLQKTYSYVPMQDFSKPWSDEELYAKYNLSQEEIEFIETMVAPMEGGNE